MAEDLGFVDPTVDGAREAVPLAARPKELFGKVVGLLDNTKEQADVILQTVGDALRERYGAKELVMRRKEHYSKPAAEALIEEMAGLCDVVICAVGG